MDVSVPFIPNPGDIIGGRYQLTTVIGRGGGGVVYKALQMGIGREVALKVLAPESHFEPTAVRRFEREARLVSRLHHPNTVTCYEFNQTNEGLLYFVMEFVDGVPLKTVLEREGVVPPERAVPILRQILKSLAEAHAQGIVHRDLKPANIMLCNLHGERDFVKVLDFGVATLLDAEDQAHAQDMTRTADVVGTPKYMAPEQFRSEQLTPASDLYALACMGFEMLAGYCPFDGETLHVTIAKHLFQPPPRLPAYLDTYPRLVATIDRLLLKRADERFQRAEEVLQALEHWSLPLNQPTPALRPEEPASYAARHSMRQVTPGGPIQADRTGRSDVSMPITNNSNVGAGGVHLADAYVGSGPYRAMPSTHTPSHPHYAGPASAAGVRHDTDPSLDVLKARALRASDGRSRLPLLVLMVGATLVLAALATLVLLWRGPDAEAPAAPEKAAVPSPPVGTVPPVAGESGGAGTDLSLADLDRIALFHYASELGLTGAVNAGVRGALTRAVPAAVVPATPKTAPQPVEVSPPRAVTPAPQRSAPTISLTLNYRPADAKVSIKGARSRDCGGGRCTIRAEEGATLVVSLSAEGYDPRTTKIKATNDLMLAPLVLMRAQ